MSSIARVRNIPGVTIYKSNKAGDHSEANNFTLNAVEHPAAGSRQGHWCTSRYAFSVTWGRSNHTSAVFQDSISAANQAIQSQYLVASDAVLFFSISRETKAS